MMGATIDGQALPANYSTAVGALNDLQEAFGPTFCAVTEPRRGAGGRRKSATYMWVLVDGKEIGMPIDAAPQSTAGHLDMGVPAFAELEVVTCNLPRISTPRLVEPVDTAQGDLIFDSHSPALPYGWKRRYLVRLCRSTAWEVKVLEQ